VYYGYQFGSFWAYFQVGGNINLYWPFSVFASHMDWVSGIWNEDLIYLFAGLIGGIVLFFKDHKWSATAVFGMLYVLFVISVAHRDLARYSLPVVPIVIMGYRQVLEHKVTKLVAPILLIPIALYAWQFVLTNYQMVIDWSKYL
jgi:hypothetical protein